MQRIMMADLIRWKDSTHRKPLILEGVRQCGKTYLVEEFGHNHFAKVINVNFEDKEEYKAIFEGDLDPRRIIRQLGLMFATEIDSKNSLIFFDEVQLCGRAVTSLKYFCENAPEYRIIAAGSLLGVALSEKTAFPVGKVDRLMLRPMNFEEFLMANGKELWVKHIAQGGDYSDIKRQLQDYLLEYYVVGGMPACVKTWVESGSIEQVEKVQSALLTDYENDFAKHAPKAEYPKLTAIWHSIPNQLAKENRKFIFSRVKASWRAKDLEDSLEWLIRAGLVHKVKLIDTPGIPLDAYADDSYFKIYLCDVGLLRKLADVPPGIVFESGALYKHFKGALAENFVLTEIFKSYSRAYYWKSGNKAEVDFIIRDERDIVPIEVKAEKASRAYSLAEYRKRHKPEKALITAMETNDLPLYLLWTLKNWLEKEGSHGN